MILPTYNDEEILRELMDDWSSVKRKAKKMSLDFLANLPKDRIGFNKDRFFSYRYKHISKNEANFLTATSEVKKRS